MITPNTYTRVSLPDNAPIIINIVGGNQYNTYENTTPTGVPASGNPFTIFNIVEGDQYNWY